MKVYQDIQLNSQINLHKTEPHLPLRRQLGRVLRHHGVALLVLLVLVCLAFPGWFSALGMSFDDLTRLNAPQRMFLAHMLRKGQLPFWNPYNYGGQPFLAAGQSGPLYLPNLIFAFLPISLALKLSYAFHATVAAVSMYLIGYRLTHSRFAAIASGIVFVTSGFMIGHQIHTQMFDAMSWVPLALYFLMRGLDAPSFRNQVALAVVVALEIYAGHPQVTFYLVIVLFLSAVLVTLVTWSNGVVKRWLALTFCAILALLLSAPQWLPTVELIPYSDRAHTTDAFLLKGSLPWAGLLQFLSPFTAGGGYTNTPLAQNFSTLYGTALFWELTCYAGITALLFAVTAVVTRLFQQPVVVAMTVIGIFGILLALGGNGPLPWLLLHGPGFDLFRIPGRYTVLTELSIAVLAAVGIGVLVEAVQKRRKWPLVALTITSGLVMLILLWAWMSGPLQGQPVLALVVPLAITAVVILLTWILWIARPKYAWISTALFSLLVCFDMVFQAAGWSSFVMGASPAYTVATGADQYLAHQLTNHQPMQKVVAMPDTSLAFDQSSAFSIRALDGYDSLEPSWYANDVNLTWSAAGIFSQPRSMMDALGVRYLLSTSDVTPLWATQQTGTSSIEHKIRVPKTASGLVVQVGQVNAPEIALYGPLLSVTLSAGSHHLTELLTGMDNQNFLVPIPSDWPRQIPTDVVIRNETWQEQVQVTRALWMTTKAKASPLVSGVWVSPAPWLQVYTDGTETVWENQDATKGAFVTNNPANPLTGVSGAATSVSFEANHQVWKVTSNQPASLVLGQTYDPGWRAAVDGKTVPVTQVNDLYGEMLTAIAVPPGKHTVTLSYHPLGFRTGLLMLLTGFLVILVVPIGRKMGFKKKQQPGLS